MKADTALLHQLFLRSSGICTDSRTIKQDCLFFALKGATYDGNQFAIQALKDGAAYCIVSDPALENETGCLFVEDTLAALQALACYHRRTMTIPVLAVTGSNGKTTTKEMLTMVLSTRFKVHATKGNLNNHIGVPLTLLSTPPDSEIIICEMGANHIGEILSLCKIAEPTHGLITNIGHAHIEGFGSFEGVVKAKGELFNWLKGNRGTAFVNYDDPFVRKQGAAIENKITYGTSASPDADVIFVLETHGPDVGFSIRNRQVDVVLNSPIYGEYNAINAIAAYTVGKYFGVQTEAMIKGFASFISTSNRSEKIEFEGCTIIKDAYNANPSSMQIAIHYFGNAYPQGILVLGDMKELGTETSDAHLQVIQLTLKFPFTAVYGIGEYFLDAMQRLNLPQHYAAFPDVQTLQENWNWRKCKGNTILIKGSRSMQLEKLLTLSGDHSL